METILHKAATRGHFDHGWLQTYHTFSFANYYDPARVNFGALRVLNDDVVAPGTGFGMHPHRDMEIVTVPLHGTLEHEDSMGHASAIRPGEIQVMTAGTGIYHSEYAEKGDTPAELLQIWVIPDRRNLSPRYENAAVAGLVRRGEICTVVSPYPGDGHGLWIHQQAWFSLTELDRDTRTAYTMKSGDSYGVYAFMIEGEANIAGTDLSHRDGLGISGTDSFEIYAVGDARILLIEVPEVE